jgi:adenylylsulfate kinase
VTILFTGLSGAGKTTISQGVADRLKHQFNIEPVVLDGDVVRQQLGNSLGFGAIERARNIRHIGRLAQEAALQGSIVLVAAIAPYRYLREELRVQIGDFVEVYVYGSLAVCEARDVKGLYRRTRSGEIKQFTGIDDVYESPLSSEIVCDTDRESIEESVTKVFNRKFCSSLTVVQSRSQNVLRLAVTMAIGMLWVLRVCNS